MYTIKRHYAPHVSKPTRIIQEGLTLKEAQEHCSSEDSQLEGEWFDGYYREDEDDG